MTIGAFGSLVGAALALRVRPRYPLRASFLVIVFVSGALLALVPPLPAAAVGLACAFMFGGIQYGNAIWDTVLQQHVPRQAISRVSSYDWMISLVFMPLGYTLAGPLADAVGRDATLAAAAALSAVANVGVLAFASVRNLERLDREPADAAGEPQPVQAAPG